MHLFCTSTSILQSEYAHESAECLKQKSSVFFKPKFNNCNSTPVIFCNREVQPSTVQVLCIVPTQNYPLQYLQNIEKKVVPDAME